MTWETELAKVENDALRTSGDVAGIMAKYGAPTGAPVWSNKPYDEIIPIITDSLKALDNTAWDNFFTTSILGNNANKLVRLSVDTVRTDIEAFVTVDEWAQITAIANEQDTLAESLGLPLRERAISRALRELADSPQAINIVREQTVQNIMGKMATLRTLTLADLQTIDGLLP